MCLQFVARENDDGSAHGCKSLFQAGGAKKIFLLAPPGFSSAPPNFWELGGLSPPTKYQIMGGLAPKILGYREAKLSKFQIIRGQPFSRFFATLPASTTNISLSEQKCSSFELNVFLRK